MASISLWTCDAAAQTDSITIAEEKMDRSTFASLVDGYNKVIRADQEELRLFKIDLLGPLLYAFSDSESIDSLGQNVVGLSYEQKINPSWSWILGTVIRANQMEVTQVEFEAGVRYYYNLKHRMLKGKSANNFSANYLGVALNGRRDLVADDFRSSIRTMAGIQRRIGKYGYVDFNLGLDAIYAPLDTRKARIDTFIRIGVGIGFGW